MVSEWVARRWESDYQVTQVGRGDRRDKATVVESSSRRFVR